MPSHLLSSFEVQRYQKEPKFNCVFSRNNLLKIKNGTYLINPDKYKSVGTHWIALYANDDNVTSFDSFEVEHIPKKILKFIGNKEYYNKYL